MTINLAVVKGDYNGSFVCGLVFGFSPLVCIQAPPKVEDVFVGKSVDECKNIADKYGFQFSIYEMMEHPKYERNKW